MELKRLYALLDEKDLKDYDNSEVVSQCATVIGLSEKEIKKYVDAYALKKKEYFYKRMKKHCQTKIEMALRVNLYTMDDKYTASKLHISPKRLDSFLEKAKPEETKKIYDDLMALEKRTKNEDMYCIMLSGIFIMAIIKAKIGHYYTLLGEGYTEEEAAGDVERTPEKIMEYLGMSMEELEKYAMQRVYSYCNEDKTHLHTHFMDMEF